MNSKKLNKKNLILLILLLLLLLLVFATIFVFVNNKSSKPSYINNPVNPNDIELNDKGLPATLDGVYSYSYDLTQHSDKEYLANAISVLEDTYAQDNNKSSENEENSDKDEKGPFFDLVKTPFVANIIGFFGLKDQLADQDNASSMVYYKFDSPSRSLCISGEKKEGYKESSTTGLPAWHEVFAKSAFDIYHVKIESKVTPAKTIAWFSVIDEQSQEIDKLPNIKTFEGLENIDMTNVTDSSFMFCGDVHADIQWTPSSLGNIENAFAMFSWTGASTETLNHFAKNLTSNKVWAFTFSNNDNLSTIDVENIDFANATNVSCMFCKNKNLENILNLEEKSVTNANSLSSMFYLCQKLKEINCSKLCTSSVTSLAGVFADTRVTVLKLDEWDCSNVTDIRGAFSGCKTLTLIYVAENTNWSKKVESEQDVFNNCSNLLTGSSGTKYDSANINSSFACVDGGSRNPGYFSAINMHFAYAVSIWDIDTSADSANITFGPATGPYINSLCVDGYSTNHNTNDPDVHCIHTDTWEEICENIENNHADYYSHCLEYGCTKDVYLSDNTKLFSHYPENFVRCSSLFNFIKGANRPTGDTGLCYTCINDTSSTDNFESANWATSRMRATLNGNANEWTASSYAGDECCTTANCLLSSFPEILQTKIKPKTHMVCKSWELTPPYNTDEENLIEVSDKLWFPTGPQIFQNSSDAYYMYGGNPEGDALLDKYELANLKYFNAYGRLKAWDETGNPKEYWLMSPLRLNKNTFVFVNIWGSVLNGSNVDSSVNGISPFFVL